MSHLSYMEKLLDGVGVERLIRASFGNRVKENLIVDFINQTDLDETIDATSIIDALFTFAQAEQKRNTPARMGLS